MSQPVHLSSVSVLGKPSKSQLSICLILISSFRLPFAFPDPSFQCAVRQVCVGQWLCYFLDASYPDGLGDIFNPAPCLSLCSAHGGTSQAHRSLRGAQSHRLLSPQSRGRVTGQKQPVKEHEEPEDDWGKMGQEKEERLHGEQMTRLKKYPPPNLFHKKTHLPVHVTFYVLTTLKKQRSGWILFLLSSLTCISFGRPNFSHNRLIARCPRSATVPGSWRVTTSTSLVESSP